MKKLGQYIEESAPMFTALFITREKEKQPKCLLPNEWMTKTWYTYTTEHLQPQEE